MFIKKDFGVEGVCGKGIPCGSRNCKASPENIARLQQDEQQENERQRIKERGGEVIF